MGAWEGFITSGTATIVITSATVAQAIASSARSAPMPASWSAGRTIAAEPVASRTAQIAGCPSPRPRAMSSPPPTPTAALAATAMMPLRNDPSSARLRSGTCIPATIISTANPIVPRKAIVGLSALISPAPVLPSAIPASSSPTTTGIRTRREDASNGPSRPATMIKVI